MEVLIHAQFQIFKYKIKYVYYRPLGNYSTYIFQEFELIYKGINNTINNNTNLLSRLYFNLKNNIKIHASAYL